ncbi:MAG: glucosaminidase domain-containing protein [Prevotella sp.]|nr:glucosaminidase domain-containing protein [Prevotella sp.]
MKATKTKIVSLMLLAPLAIKAQANVGGFYTVGVKKTTRIDLTEKVEDSVSRNYSTSLPDSLELKEDDLSMLSETQLESLIREYEKYLSEKDKKCHQSKNNQLVIKYYDGESHTLCLENLHEVMKEVGVSNQLFVLAQAVLETGNFQSRVCKQYNNLFGLYDSRHKDYYRFARWEDSVVGYIKLIQYKYKGGNYLQFLKKVRYAEDPGYIRKVAKIARQLYEEYISKKGGDA